MVCDAKGQTIPAKLRAKWLKEAHPKAHIRVIKDIGKDDDSVAWADYTIKLLGYVPDVAFTSEEYGTPWCKAMNCEHFLVDIDRIKYPVSGTKVRANPYKYWQYLSPPVKAYYAKRICDVGAESTGTTTLSMALADHYKTTWVPEYGRFYTEGKLVADSVGKNWYSHEFSAIADMQNQTEDELARYCNKLLICDTNAFATELWHERYMGSMSKAVAKLAIKNNYDLYIVTGDEIPFVQDGMRDGEHIRHQMHKRFIEELKKRKLPYLVVTGSVQERLDKSVKYIDKLVTAA
jgi:NadR type nicotinamide-nucleotide adenylyltransferase